MFSDVQRAWVTHGHCRNWSRRARRTRDEREERNERGMLGRGEGEGGGGWERCVHSRLVRCRRVDQRAPRARVESEREGDVVRGREAAKGKRCIRSNKGPNIAISVTQGLIRYRASLQGPISLQTLLRARRPTPDVLSFKRRAFAEST